MTVDAPNALTKLRDNPDGEYIVTVAVKLSVPVSTVALGETNGAMVKVNGQSLNNTISVDAEKDFEAVVSPSDAKEYVISRVTYNGKEVYSGEKEGEVTLTLEADAEGETSTISVEQIRKQIVLKAG